MRSLLTGLLLVALASTAMAEGIEGRYEVKGKNANGTAYGGTAEITATSENTCRIVWDVGTTSNGICMRNQNAFAAGYVLGDKVGLVIYEVNRAMEASRDDARSA